MREQAPLATIPVSFFDHQTGRSALAMQHLHAGGRTVVVYHDAPGVAAARPLLSGVAETIAAELGEGQTLSLIECSVPEHAAEPHIYARVTLSSTTATGRIDAGPGRVVSIESVARACGLEVAEIERTEALVAAVHQPRSCAFPGFRQLRLGERAGRGLAAA